MSGRKPKKYDHNQFIWHNEDFYIDCSRPVIKCRFGYKGHPTSHLNQNVVKYNDKGELQLQVIKKVAHSHFTHEFDLGRHTTCEIERTWILAKHCDKEYVLHKKTLPAWIRRDLYGE